VVRGVKSAVASMNNLASNPQEAYIYPSPLRVLRQALHLRRKRAVKQLVPLRVIYQPSCDDVVAAMQQSNHQRSPGRQVRPRVHRIETSARCMCQVAKWKPPESSYGLRGLLKKVPETISRRLVSMRSKQAFRFARRRSLNPVAGSRIPRE
jgi:hypothetical protein